MWRRLSLLIATMILFGFGVFGGRALNVLAQWVSTPPAIALGDRSDLLRRANADIVLFSLSTCPYCREARAWLQKHRLPFTELVVDSSEPAQRLFDELKEPALPVLITRDRLIRGFEPDAYAEATVALGLASWPTAVGHDAQQRSAE